MDVTTPPTTVAVAVAPDPPPPVKPTTTVFSPVFVGLTSSTSAFGTATRIRSITVPMLVAYTEGVIFAVLSLVPRM
jgi:hypothetical protein